MMETRDYTDIKRRLRQTGMIGLSLICALIVTGILLGFASQKFVMPASAKSNHAPADINLSVAKSHTGNFTASNPGYYTILVTNEGDPISSGDVTVSDVVPGAFSSPSASGSGWTISWDDHTFTAVYPITSNIETDGTLPPIYITVTVPTASSTIITNTATLEYIGDTDTTDNTANDPTIVNPIDLGVTKSYSPASPLEGGLITFMVVVKNNGPLDATGVKLTDAIPAGVTYYSHNVDSGQSYNPSTGLWTIGSLANSASTTLTLVGRINLGTASTTINNIAGPVTSDCPDSNASNNSAFTQFTVGAAADLQIDKTDNKSTVYQSEAFNYTIYITNTGSITASDIVITDVLPAGLTYIDDSLSISPISTANTYHWIKPFTLNPGDHTSFTLSVKAASSLTLGSSLTNTVSVSTNSNEGNQSNNSALDTDTVASAETVDLQVSKLHYPETPLEGSLITYTVVVTNNSTITATNVRLTDTFPTGDVTYSNYSVSPSGSTFSLSSGLWTIGSMAKNTTVILKLIGRVNLDTGGKIITNTATVRSLDLIDSDLTNNSASVSFQVGKAADLQIRKTDYDTTISPGDRITYTIFVTNAGSIKATGVVITDILPTYLSYVTDTLSSLSIAYITTTDKIYYWNYPYAINAGSTITFNLGVKAASSMSGDSIVNNIKVNTNVDEGNKSNNSTADTNAITYSPSVSFSKSASPTEQKLNSYITFSIIVTNNSGYAISSVVVKDTFSTSYLDISSVSTTRGSASYNSSTNLVTISIGTLSAGATATISVSCKVVNASTSAVSLTNYAYLTYSYSGNSFNKTASASYRISSSSGSTLPTTGGVQANWNTAQEAGMTAGEILAIICSMFLFVVGIALLVLWRRFTVKQSEWAGWCLRMGGVMLVVAVGFAFAAWGLSGFSSQPAISLPEPTQEAVVEQLITDLRPIDIPPADDELEFLPDYPVPTPSIVPTMESTEQPVDDSSPVRLLIPDLAVDTVIKYVPFEADTWLISGLKQEVAWLGNTSWPGLGGNTGLAGHVTLNTGENGPFRYLDQLTNGSVITLFTKKNIYNYKVREAIVVDSSQVSVLDPTTNPSLTLITCTNWDKTLGYYVNRYIVFADLDTTVPIAVSMTGN